jgi:hypothetical protein
MTFENISALNVTKTSPREISRAKAEEKAYRSRKKKEK